MNTILLENTTDYISDLNKQITEKETEGYTVITTHVVAGNNYDKYSQYPTIVVVMQKSK